MYSPDQGGGNQVLESGWDCRVEDLYNNSSTDAVLERKGVGCRESCKALDVQL